MPQIRAIEKVLLYSYIKKKPDALILKFIFGNKIRHVSNSSSVHHQEFFTVHTGIVYVIQVY